MAKYILIVNQTNEPMETYVDLFTCDTLTKRDYALISELFELKTDCYDFIVIVGDYLEELKEQAEVLMEAGSPKVRKELAEKLTWEYKVQADSYETFESAMYDLGYLDNDYIHDFYNNHKD